MVLDKKPFETVAIICDGPRPGIPGQMTTCSICAAEVYLSDSSLRSIQKNGLQAHRLEIHCLTCARSNLMGGSFQTIPLTEEQKQEISLGINNSFKAD